MRNTNRRFDLWQIQSSDYPADMRKSVPDQEMWASDLFAPRDGACARFARDVLRAVEDSGERDWPGARVAEQEKPSRERGFYRNPELFGQPEEKQTQWGRHPQQMQQMKAMRERQKLRAQQQSDGPQAGETLSHDQPASAVDKSFPTPPAPKPPSPVTGRPLTRPSAPATQPVAELNQY